MGLKRGDHLLIMLGNVAPLWVSLLAAMKLGAVVIPYLHPAFRRRARRPPPPAARSGSSSPPPSSPSVSHQTLLLVPTGRTASRSAERQPAGSPTPTPKIRPHGLHPRRPHQGVRPAAALLHLRHDIAAEAGVAQPRLLPRRPPLSTLYWLGLKPGDRHPQHLLTRLGQARLEPRLRAVAGRGERGRAQPSPLLDAAGALRDPEARGGHHLLRPAHRLAADDPAGPGPSPTEVAPRADRRRRAADSGGDRAGAGGLGARHPRRLRPDRDDGAGRQHASPRQ